MRNHCPNGGRKWHCYIEDQVRGEAHDGEAFTMYVNLAKYIMMIMTSLSVQMREY
jgi:hypothetical protein